MSKVIWKYNLDVTDIQQQLIPEGGEILHIDNQHEQICMWILVDPNIPSEERTFMVKGTGSYIEEGDLVDTKFIGTVIVSGGRLVWHVWECGIVGK